MKPLGRIALLLVLGSVLLPAPAFPGQAPFYQGKNLTFLINFAAGGPTDIEGRIVARHLAKPATVEQAREILSLPVRAS